MINEKDLVEAINNGNIAGAGLDVFQDESPKKDNILWSVDNIIATPHMGASTYESLERMVIGASKNIIQVLNH